MNSMYFKSQDENQNIDVYDLFVYYNNFFFQGMLQKCSVQWSQKMTLCAGSCANTYHESCVIKLSAPILKFRTANQIKQTLLHQMIHAFLFLTNPKACQTEGGHGKEFKTIMQHINAITGLNITVFHNFHDEVDLYRTHIWKCDGVCQMRPPFYGYVKRSMNRRPQPADSWFKEHQRTCGGHFTKISGPDELSKGKKGSKQKKGQKLSGSGKSIEDYFKQMQNDKEKKKRVKKERILTDLGEESKVKNSSSSVFEKKGKSLQDYCSEIKSESLGMNKEDDFSMKRQQ